MRNNRFSVFIMILALMLVLAACGGQEKTSDQTSASENSSGGELRVALSGQPPTLDPPMGSLILTRDTSRLMFETLVTPNAQYEAVPMLAESVDTSDDSMTYTFHLRKGVKFHNGEEMTAEDVVASMYRWLEKSTTTGNIFNGATFEAEDDYTVVLQLTQPSSLTLDTLAATKMAPAIMPKEIVESAAPEGVTEYIGTGPYKFVEWKQDQYIHFTKYEEYQSAEGDVDGLAGKKEALVDDIYFDIVTDSSTRIAGLQTGKYDVITSVPYDSYDQLESGPNTFMVPDNYGEVALIYNEVQGLASNFKMREAINAALDVEEIMMAAVTNENLFSLTSGYMTSSISNWASDAGSEYYNQNDQEKAKKLLKESGYNNEEFTLITTRDLPHYYNASVVIQDQLTKLGMNVKLEVYDSAGWSDKQNNHLGDWDAVVMGFSTVSTPTQLLALSPAYAGGVHDPKIRELSAALEIAPSQEEAKQIWDELQGYAWEKHLPVTIIGNYQVLYAASDKVEGISTFSGILYWNTKKVE